MDNKILVHKEQKSDTDVDSTHPDFPLVCGNTLLFILKCGKILDLHPPVKFSYQIKIIKEHFEYYSGVLFADTFIEDVLKIYNKHKCLFSHKDTTQVLYLYTILSKDVILMFDVDKFADTYDIYKDGIAGTYYKYMCRGLKCRYPGIRPSNPIREKNFCKGYNTRMHVRYGDVDMDDDDGIIIDKDRGYNSDDDEFSAFTTSKPQTKNCTKHNLVKIGRYIKCDKCSTFKILCEESEHIYDSYTDTMSIMFYKCRTCNKIKN